MRKIFLFLSVLLCAIPGFVHAEVLKADSKIKDVTVYPGSARVTREVVVNLTPGEHSVSLEKIVPYLDENSLTVQGKGAADVKIFGAYVRTNYLEKSSNDKVEELEAAIENVQDQLNSERYQLTIIGQEKDYLNSVRLFSGQQIPKDLVTTMPTPVYLEEIRGFLTKSFTDLKKQEESTNVKIRDLQRKLEALQRELNQIRSGEYNSDRSIMIDFECVKGGQFTFNVAYLVNGAGWRPVYDGRVNHGKGDVELTSFGMIQQTTGEDWDEVNLTLSTAKPMIGGRMPYIDPWFLSEYVPPVPVAQGRLMRATAVSDEAVQYEAFNLEATYAPETPGVPSPERKASLAYADVGQQGVSITYKIARPVTMKSDGVENKFPVSTQMLKANFEYSTYPRLSNYAYLGSKVVNSKDLQLLAGEVNLFLEGEFVGKSSIDTIGPGQEFDLYLGIDENIQVKREQISKKKDDVLLGGIPSPNIKTTFVYKLTVENASNKAVSVNLYEAIPVSQSDRIKVKILDVSAQPQTKDWKDRKGIWLWQLKLAANQKQEITYSYVVEHGKDIQVGGL